MRELHLFAGIGGGILGGMMLGHHPVAAVEIDPFCQQILYERFPGLRLFPDVKSFRGEHWRGEIDIVCGGFPCQPWSCAGKGKGKEDPRHLWPEMARIISEVQPSFVFAENVNIKAFEEPFHDLQRLGYRIAPALCLGAVDVGAPHRRNRWWLLAAFTDADCTRLERRDSRGVQECSTELTVGSSVSSSSNADCLRELQQAGGIQDKWRWLGDSSWWKFEPDVGRVAHGIPARMERLRALGNAQIPLAAASAFMILSQQLQEMK